MRPLRGRGRMRGIGYPGSATPGYVMGMLRIPQNEHPGGCGGKRFTPVRMQRRLSIPRICCTPGGVQEKIDAWNLWLGINGPKTFADTSSF